VGQGWYSKFFHPSFFAYLLSPPSCSSSPGLCSLPFCRRLQPHSHLPILTSPFHLTVPHRPHSLTISTSPFHLTVPTVPTPSPSPSHHPHLIIPTSSSPPHHSQLPPPTTSPHHPHSTAHTHHHTITYLYYPLALSRCLPFLSSLSLLRRTLFPAVLVYLFYIYTLSVCLR